MQLQCYLDRQSSFSSSILTESCMDISIYSERTTKRRENMDDDAKCKKEDKEKCVFSQRLPYHHTEESKNKNK